MTVPVAGGVGVVAPKVATVLGRRTKWKQLFFQPPEIPATRLTCHASGSLRPKLGLCILCVALTSAVCLVLVPLLVAETPSSSSDALARTMAAVPQISAANARFAGKIYPEMVATGGHQNNMACSPFSLSSVLAMLRAGAAGETGEQLDAVASNPKLSVLLEGYRAAGDALKSPENFTLETANRLYVQKDYPILDDYLALAEKHFTASAENLDFGASEAARGLINAWVEEKTHERIKNLIPEGAIHPLVRLVLVNAVYFKGDWANKFDPAATKLGEFHISETETVEVPMMRATRDVVLGFDKGLESHILQLPYKGDRLSMLIFLPKDGKNFFKMEEQLSATGFDAAANFKGPRKNKVDFSLPKFKLQTEHNLVEVLKKLGVRDMFHGDKANFSGLSKRNELFVSVVVQKAFVEVNEEGTEAAAATGAVMMLRMAPMVRKLEFNRPFIFVIKDDVTGLILVAGRVMNPKLE